MTRLQFYIKALLCLVLVLPLIAGCNLPGARRTAGPNTPAATEATPGAPAQTDPGGTPQTGSVTTAPPQASSTPQPLAARVGQLEISLAEYAAELRQFQAANGGVEPTPADRTRVLENLIDQALLAQAAVEAGYQIDEAELQVRLDALTEQAGGEAALQAWIQQNGYDTGIFRQALERSAAAAWMRDRIITSVPRSAEQIHARQILLYNPEQANEVYSLLQGGNDFGNLAVQYDPLTRGELGWFPRGYLTDRKLDEAVFALQADGYSDIIQTAAGYHILQVIERQDARPLSPEALLKLQAQALAQWLADQREGSQIEILLP